jgi:DNA polymerase III epsilon subunit-like protein
MRRLVFDTETTGLIVAPNAPDKGPFVIEISWMILNDKGEPEADPIPKHHLVAPPDNKLKYYSEAAQKVTGIKPEELQGARDWELVSRDFLKDLSGVDQVIAHNVSYDVDVVNRNNEFHDLNAINWPPLICTVEQTAFVLGRRLKQEELYQYLFNQSMPYKAHRADQDVLSLCDCVRKLIQMGWLK